MSEVVAPAWQILVGPGLAACASFAALAVQWWSNAKTLRENARVAVVSRQQQRREAAYVEAVTYVESVVEAAASLRAAAQGAKDAKGSPSADWEGMVKAVAKPRSEAKDRRVYLFSSEIVLQDVQRFDQVYRAVTRQALLCQQTDADRLRSRHLECCEQLAAQIPDLIVIGSSILGSVRAEMAES